ncbi:hypothetical protein ANO11243_087090 [Dothideomycetidae sp. 11243]|nr:hypothetical protein ANO11243_087090 [fungal sp. No.11243]
MTRLIPTLVSFLLHLSLATAAQVTLRFEALYALDGRMDLLSANPYTMTETTPGTVWHSLRSWARQSGEYAVYGSEADITVALARPVASYDDADEEVEYARFVVGNILERVR